MLNGTSRLLRALPLEPGADFEVVAVGIDPTETPEAAASAKRRHAPDVAGSAAGGGGVHFLVGDQAAIDAVAEAAGFRYVYYPDTGEFAHGSAVMVATPDGRLSHYFYGIEYVPKDVRLALVESSRGKLGSLVDQVLLLCFHYDPTTGKYGFAIVGALRAAGILTVVALATYMAVQLARDRRGQGPASAVPATSRGEAS